MFGFTASGDSQETIAQLRALTAAQLSNDQSATMARDLIITGIAECSADLEPHQVYTVHVRGDSSTTRGFTLHATVEIGDRLDYEPPET